MPRQVRPLKRLKAPISFLRLFKPALDEVSSVTPILSRSNRPMTFTFEHHLKALVYLHLHEYESGRELLQVMAQTEMYHLLQAKANKLLPAFHPRLGNLVAIDGSLIDAVASRQWADYRDGSKKAKVHVGFLCYKSALIR